MDKTFTRKIDKSKKKVKQPLVLNKVAQEKKKDKDK
jgi:hypothetical protein